MKEKNEINLSDSVLTKVIINVHAKNRKLLS
jgi:hypothetical protein